MVSLVAAKKYFDCPSAATEPLPDTDLWLQDVPASHFQLNKASFPSIHTTTAQLEPFANQILLGNTTNPRPRSQDSVRWEDPRYMRKLIFTMLLQVHSAWAEYRLLLCLKARVLIFMV